MRAASTQRRAPRPFEQTLYLPAPMGGLNAVDAAGAAPAGDCLLLYNLVPGQYGLQTRPGSREWSTGLTGSIDNKVRSMVPFFGSQRNGARDRLFSATSSGLSNCSSSGTPTASYTFTDQGASAGFGVSHGFVNSAGSHYLLYADEANGALIYDESADTWSVPAITGVAMGSIVFVAVFKNRLWLVERDTDKAWYLDAGAIAGAATAFRFGAQFKRGGPLVGLWNWTYDGGSGVDDSLVAVSQGGDVVIYQGTDPASASTFGLKGVWSCGAIPEGRQIATDFGGDLLIATRTGLLPMSRLVSGQALSDDQYTTAKISGLFNGLMRTQATAKGWSLRLHPEENLLLVTAPTGPETSTEQLAYSLSRRSWSRYRDLPLYSSCSWGGKLYMGTVDGRVLVNDGTVDGVTLASPAANTPIQYSMISAYSNLGTARTKRVHRIRPTILADEVTADFEVAARYGFSLSEISSVSSSSAEEGEWGGSTWGTSLWGSQNTATQKLRGATGAGVDVAIALRGAARSRHTVVGFDVVFSQGGLV